MDVLEEGRSMWVGTDHIFGTLGRQIRQGVVALMLLGMVPQGASADALPTPTGEVLLTVRGVLGTTNGNGMARFDREMLEGMPQKTVTTSTIWTEGVNAFTGVSLKTLLDALQTEGTHIRATALNDYSVTIPFSDATAEGPILATRLNGETISQRTKGPIWIVYPYDSGAQYRTETIHTRSIWQLDRMEIIAQ
ncbi:MAG: molybdopterin-dependent oxidoreductase [Pseudomonadota bacterium]